MTKINYCVFDDELKEMTIELFEAKGSVKEDATELDIALCAKQVARQA